MASIKESANRYEPQETMNVADLEAVSVNQEISERTFKEGTADEFTVKVINVLGKEYRVPETVLKQLKSILVEKPNMTMFKVKKEGTGLKTSYTVIPID